MTIRHQYQYKDKTIEVSPRIKLGNQSFGLESSKLHQINAELLGAMLPPCLRDLSKHDLRKVPEGGYRNLKSAFSE